MCASEVRGRASPVHCFRTYALVHLEFYQLGKVDIRINYLSGIPETLSHFNQWGIKRPGRAWDKTLFCVKTVIVRKSSSALSLILTIIKRKITLWNL